MDGAIHVLLLLGQDWWLHWDGMTTHTKLTSYGRRLIRRCGLITLHPGQFYQ